MLVSIQFMGIIISTVSLTELKIRGARANMQTVNAKMT